MFKARSNVFPHIRKHKNSKPLKNFDVSHQSITQYVYGKCNVILAEKLTKGNIACMTKKMYYLYRYPTYSICKGRQHICIIKCSKIPILYIIMQLKLLQGVVQLKRQKPGPDPGFLLLPEGLAEVQPCILEPLAVVLLGQRKEACHRGFAPMNSHRFCSHTSFNLRRS